MKQLSHALFVAVGIPYWPFKGWVHLMSKMSYKCVFFQLNLRLFCKFSSSMIGDARYPHSWPACLMWLDPHWSLVLTHSSGVGQNISEMPLNPPGN